MSAITRQTRQRRANTCMYGVSLRQLSSQTIHPEDGTFSLRIFEVTRSCVRTRLYSCSLFLSVTRQSELFFLLRGMHHGGQSYTLSSAYSTYRVDLLLSLSVSLMSSACPCCRERGGSWSTGDVRVFVSCRWCLSSCRLHSTERNRQTSSLASLCREDELLNRKNLFYGGPSRKISW